MTSNAKIKVLNPIVPMAALIISTTALSGSPINISLNTANVEYENVGLVDIRACMSTGSRKRDFITSILDTFSFYEEYSTNTSLSVDVISPSFNAPNLTLNGKISELSTIEYDWDGYGGYAPTQQVINNIYQFIQSLPEKYTLKIDEDNVFPNPNGTITIQWINDSGKVSIEIGNTTAAFFSYINGKYDMQEKLSTMFLSEKFIAALDNLTNV